MSTLKAARELAKTIEITDEIRELGEENIGDFADEETRLFYYDRGTRFLNTELNADVIAASLHYRVEYDESPIGDEHAVSLGTTKLKGLPHLPADFEWPTGHLFAAQINLDDFSQYDVENYLPDHGMLYLFFSQDGSGVVHYYDGPTDALTITDYPDHVELKYYGEFRRGATLTFDPGFIFYIDSDEYDEFAELVPDDLRKKLTALFGCEMKDSDTTEGLFGRPQWWQGEDELWPDEEPDEIDTVLFQFEFGEGHIHFWFDPDKGRTGDFSAAWVSYSGT